MQAGEFNKKKKYSEVSGVSAYVESRIQVKMNNKGLYEEVVNAPDSFSLNSLVEKVSPHLNSVVNESVIAKDLYSEVDEINYDERIGYYKSLFVGHVVEGDYRKKASSGGMGTWIFKELLEKKIIDGVIHVKKNTDATSPILFKYEVSRTIEEIQAGAKTKYYPVELSRVLELIKQNEGKYAVVGIPSFIKAVRLLSLHDHIIKERIVLTVGLICGHQKSSKFAEFMGWQVGINPGDLKEIDFRYKLDNCPADSYAIKMIGEINGESKTIIRPKDELKGQNWGLGYFKALSSDFTDDVFNETADIVVGDAWLPEYTEDSEGNNIIIVRNPTIDKLLTDAMQEKKLSMNEVGVQKIFDSQASHYRHTHDELAYRMHMGKMKRNWYPKNRVLESNDISFFRAKVQNIRMEISIKSHLLYEKAVERKDLEYFTRKMGVLSYKYKLVYYMMAIQNKGLKGVIKMIIKKIVS